MTRLQHLTALRDKVKAGECSHGTFADELINDNPNDGECVQQAIWAHHAYHGSLDAAKALHDSLLPGMGWTLTSHNQARILQEMPPLVYVDFQDGETPARAWLLAILSALMRKETEI